MNQVAVSVRSGTFLPPRTTAQPEPSPVLPMSAERVQRFGATMALSHVERLAQKRSLQRGHHKENPTRVHKCLGYWNWHWNSQVKF